MKNEKVIIEAKKEQNLFTLNLANLRKAIAVISPSNNIQHYIIAMIRQGRPIYLISQSKQVQF